MFSFIYKSFSQFFYLQLLLQAKSNLIAAFLIFSPKQAFLPNSFRFSID